MEPDYDKMDKEILILVIAVIVIFVAFTCGYYYDATHTRHQEKTNSIPNTAYQHQQKFSSPKQQFLTQAPCLRFFVDENCNFENQNQKILFRNCRLKTIKI